MKKYKESNGEKQSRLRPALSEDARQKQLIALAVNLAEEQLRNGTASSQVITHYLKLGSTREKLEQESLKVKTRLDSAKIKSLESAERIDELYAKAIKSMRSYAGKDDQEEEDDSDIL